MLCPKCQTENPEGTKFCTSCGNPLIVSSGEQVVSQPTVSPSQEPPKSNKKTFIIIGIIVFLFLLVGGLFFVGRRLRQRKLLRKEIPSYSIPTPSPFTTFPKEEQTVTLSRYDIDSDGDAIPDFVELATGYDPHKQDCVEKAGCGTGTGADVTTAQKNILFILDASGSMAQMAGGQQKMIAAKQALKDYIETVASDTNVGLMVYGHKGSNSPTDKAVSCAGIEILYPLGPVNKEQFKAAVDSFQPTGWTPIADSLTKAKNEAFGGKEGQKNYIVLVSDGIETCDGNPVTAADELKKSSAAATVEVIGFAVDATVQSQLQQIAEISGGDYYSASNLDELAKAISEIDEKVGEAITALSCLATNFITYQSCLSRQFIAAQTHLSELKFEAAKRRDDQERNKIIEVSQKITDVTSKLSQLSIQMVNASEEEQLKILKELSEAQKQAIQ